MDIDVFTVHIEDVCVLLVFSADGSAVSSLILASFRAPLALAYALRNATGSSFAIVECNRAIRAMRVITYVKIKFGPNELKSRVPYFLE